MGGDALAERVFPAAGFRKREKEEEEGHRSETPSRILSFGVMFITAH